MEKLEIKQFFETEYATKPQKATLESAGYDLFAACSKTILPGQSAKITLDLRWAIPSGFCGRILSRSSLVVEHSVTVEGGLIDSDYRGVVQVIMFNHHPTKCYTVKEGERIAQVIFLKKYDVNFLEVNTVSKLGETDRQEDGFGSSGKTVIKKMKFDSDQEEIKIKCEEAILVENDKLVLHEKIDH